MSTPVAPVTAAAAAATAQAELWRSMPPLDDVTVDRLRQILFPRHAARPEQAETTKT